MSAHALPRQWVGWRTSDSGRGKMVLNVDLNEPPSLEDRMPEEAAVTVSSSANQESPAPVDPQCVRSVVEQQLVQYLGPANEGGYNSPIDVDAIKDEVEVLTSPRDFSQVRNRLRRNRSETLIFEDNSEHNLGHEEDTELRLSFYGCNKRIRSTVHNKSGNVELNLLDFLNDERPSLIAPLEVKSNEPTFNCPVCLSTIDDACSTICGHIFCEKCIKETIKRLKCCPTCRRKLTRRSNYHRVYLPASG